MRAFITMATEREIEEIKTKLNIYDVISGYITLKKSGSNYFGLCPFHHEKSPSFSVNADLGFYKCFGCQEAGDVITFIQKIENLSFGEAIEKLAQKAGIQLSTSFKEEKSQKKRILEMNALAQQLFTYLLFKHPIGEVGLKYISNRNISKDTALEFGLGYDKGNALVQTLRKRGFLDDEILSFGLGVIRQGKLVDKYRGRIIFPIYSVSGDIVGFSGRIIEKNDQLPKYINSPDTDAFKKSNILYGLYQTKKDIKESDQVILLEGPIDVISAYQNGVRNVCAVQGTSLTSSHLDLLKRFTQNITFCFDQDSAGLKALQRSFFIATESMVLPKVIRITGAKDVDEKVNKDPAGFKKDMQLTMDIVEYLLNLSIEKNNISMLDGKLKVIQEVLPLIGQISNEMKKSFYISKIAEAVQVDEKEIRKMMVVKDIAKKNEAVRTIERKLSREQARIEYLLAIFLQEYTQLKTYISDFDLSLIYDPDIRAIIVQLKDAIKEDKSIKDLIESLPEDMKSLCLNLMAVNLHNEQTEVETELESIEKILKKKKAIREINELKNKLWVYEKEQDEKQIEVAMNEISRLSIIIQE